MKKVLIMCMSCNVESYLQQEGYIKETWGKDIDDGLYPGFKYVFFRSGKDGVFHPEEKVLEVRTGDTLKETAEKTNRAMVYLTQMFFYDYVIITNMTTYMNLRLINDFVNSDLIENDKMYGGDFLIPLFMPPFVRGNFMLFSREMAIRLISQNRIYNMANDINICMTLLYDLIQDHDTYRNTFKQVNAVREYKWIDREKMNNCFYVSLKSYGDIGEVEKHMHEMHEIFRDIGECDNLQDTVYPVRYVSTGTKLYKIEVYE